MRSRWWRTFPARALHGLPMAGLAGGAERDGGRCMEALWTRPTVAASEALREVGFAPVHLPFWQNKRISDTLHLHMHAGRGAATVGAAFMMASAA